MIWRRARGNVIRKSRFELHGVEEILVVVR